MELSEPGKFLRVVYTFFVGVLLAIFVGVGINTFYVSPAEPQYPIELNSTGKELTTQEQTLQRNYDKSRRAYEEKLKPYNRNVSMLALGSAIVLLIISLLFENRIKIMSDGVMMGGLFTMVYSIGRGFASQNSKYMFVLVTVGLAAVLVMGYRRFVQHIPPTSTSRPAHAT